MVNSSSSCTYDINFMSYVQQDCIFFISVLLYNIIDISLKDNLGRNALHCVCASKSEGPITTAFKIIMER